MKRLLLYLALVPLCATYQPGYCEQVTQEEQAQWIRYTVPLPKSISIKEKVEVAKGGVMFAVPAPACDGLAPQDLVIGQALRELDELTRGPVTSKWSFTIGLALGGPDAEPLKKLKNSDQAYLIKPTGDKGLQLTALTPRGLYYAAKTLQQLIAAKSTADKLVIPLVNVTDWPDMEDRGLWGTDCEARLRWMADRKYNLIEMISNRHVSPEGVATSEPKGGRQTKMITEGPFYAINPVPDVLHLEQVTNSGVFDAFPNLRAKSKKKGAWCYSQPQAAEVIAGWIMDLASLPHVKEVDVWLSENMNGLIGCQCDLCKAEKVDPQVLEARTVVKAWKLAKQKSGKDIGLRMLTSEACEHFNEIILPELPKEVKVVYYHSLMTYTHAKVPMIHPYLEEFVKKGGWLSVCPSLGGIPNYPEPFTCPQFINTRMNEYLDKGLRGLLGYASPGIMYTDLNVEAAAEWTWNIKGRTIHEFSASYAVRQGYKDPEKFAEFVDVLGAIEENAYACDYPWRACRKMITPVDVQLKEGALPELGTFRDGFNGFPFGGYQTKEQLAGDVAAAAKAVQLAREIGIEEYIQESLVVQGYVQSLKALYDLKTLVKNGKIAPKNKAEAAKAFQTFADGLRQSAKALPKWEQIVTWPGNRVSGDRQAVAVICREDLIDRLVPYAKTLGIEVK